MKASTVASSSTNPCSTRKTDASLVVSFNTTTIPTPHFVHLFWSFHVFVFPPPIVESCAFSRLPPMFVSYLRIW